MNFRHLDSLEHASCDLNSHNWHNKIHPTKTGKFRLEHRNFRLLAGRTRIGPNFLLIAKKKLWTNLKNLLCITLNILFILYWQGTFNTTQNHIQNGGILAWDNGFLCGYSDVLHRTTCWKVPYGYWLCIITMFMFRWGNLRSKTDMLDWPKVHNQ